MTNSALEKRSHPSGVEELGATEASLDGQGAEPESNGGLSNSNIVDWDGSGDPEHPMNWSGGRRWAIILCVLIIVLITPLGSSMMAPALPQIERDLYIGSSEVAVLLVTIYVLGFGFGPLVVAPLSEIYGRNVVYQVGNVCYTALSAGCALAPNTPALLVLRLLSGGFGGAPLIVGGGTVSDLVPAEKRGFVTALLVLGMLVGPIIGPTVGGFLSEAEGWRWIFWLLAILSGAVTLISIFVLRETYGPVLLSRRTKKLRCKTGNKLLVPRDQLGISPVELLIHSMVRPVKLLCLSPVGLILAIYMAVVYGTIYLILATFAVVFQQQYHFSESISGLTYIGVGLGTAVALLGLGRYNDVAHARLVKKNGGCAKPEFRLTSMKYGAPVLPAGMIIYGWSVEYRTHWIVPIIGATVTGIGAVAAFISIQTYLIDAFEPHAASALAANSLLRCVAAGLLPLSALPLYTDLGYGWGNTLLAFIALGFSLPAVAICRYGEKLRQRFPVYPG